MQKHKAMTDLRVKFNQKYPNENKIPMGSGNYNSNLVIATEKPMLPEQRSFYNKLMKAANYATHRVFLTVWTRCSILTCEENQAMLAEEIAIINPLVVLFIPNRHASWIPYQFVKHEMTEFFGRPFLTTVGFDDVLNAEEKNQKRLKLAMLSDLKQLSSYYIMS